MNEFNREYDRYMVAKTSDIGQALDSEKAAIFSNLLDEIHAWRITNNRSPLSCLVIESDWPEFEPAWRSIEQRATSGLSAAHMPGTIHLGDTVIDRVSGYEGIAVARHNYLNGCNRITVQRKIIEPSDELKSATFDEPQLSIKESGTVQPATMPGEPITGGPEKFSDKREY